MKALILHDTWFDTASPADSVADYRIHTTANACASMGIDFQFRRGDSASPTVAQINADPADIIIIPAISSGNQAVMAKFINGSVTKPVFVLACTTSSPSIKGTSAFADGAAVFAEARFTANPTKSLWTNIKRHTLTTGLTAPEASTALIEGTDGTSISAWKYTLDGINTVYYSLQSDRYSILHFLIEEAINDGNIDPSEVSKAPLILSIDHINAGGLFLTGGGTEVGGFQFQPDKIKELGDILRYGNGVCYTDARIDWMDDGGFPPQSGVTDGELLANLLEYNDVLKICATHHHRAEYLTTNTPWDAANTGTTKADLDGYYQNVVTEIELLGLSVDTTLATFAGNNVGVNWFELGSPEVSHKSSVDDLTVKAGYGFKAARTSPTNGDSYPRLFIPSSTFAKAPLHFLRSVSKYRGITILTGRDAGSLNSNGNTVDKNKFNSIGGGLEALNNGSIIYFHHDDFEDVTVQPSGVSTSGLINTFAMLTWQTMADYAKLCPHTVDFGADLNNYL